MSEEAEEIKKLLSFKKRLEKKVEKLKSELKEMEAILEVVNSVLLSKGFRRAEIVKTPKPQEIPASKQEETLLAPMGYKEVFSVKIPSGEELAKIYVEENALRVVLDESKTFNVNTPPFNQFLVESVLAKMQEKDRELLKVGELKPEQVFSYKILRDGDILREIVVRNFDAERLKKLKSSIRWTLEKMYEKMKGQD